MRRYLWAVGLPIAFFFMVDQPPGYSKEPRSVPKCTSMRLSYHLRNFARFFKQCQREQSCITT
jgi:hypothetical protein